VKEVLRGKRKKRKVPIHYDRVTRAQTYIVKKSYLKEKIARRLIRASKKTSHHDC